MLQWQSCHQPSYNLNTTNDSNTERAFIAAILASFIPRWRWFYRRQRALSLTVYCRLSTSIICMRVIKFVVGRGAEWLTGWLRSLSSVGRYVHSSARSLWWVADSHQPSIMCMCYAKSVKLPISRTGQRDCPVRKMGSFTGTNPNSQSHQSYNWH